MKKINTLLCAVTMICLLWAHNGLAQSTVGGVGANYSTLKAAFDAINAGTLNGNITLQITGSTTESASCVLNASGSGSASYTNILIYPTGSGYSVSGSFVGALINLNGADYVDIDGRVNQAGPADLTLANNSNSPGASVATLQFINSAENNVIEYCNIKGSQTSANSGVILFSTATSGNGNDGNIIDHNNITGGSGGRPVNVLLSLGSAGFENSGDLITNNNFYDFLRNGTASNGINLSTATTAFTITGNSFYETSSFVPSAAVAYNIIYINNASGVNFIVSDNYIGGQSALCGGSPWTKTNAFNNVFTAINLTVGTTTVSSVQNNTVQNMAWSNSGVGPWTGIAVAGGNVNVGTNTGNEIGDDNTTGSLLITGGLTGTNVYGINITGSGVVDCEFNTIASITAANSTSTLATNFYGINKTAVAGTTTISNNTIGSLTTSGSINASSGSTSNTQTLYGIYSAGTGTIVINNNTISNLVNGTTNATTATPGLVNGIASVSGTNTIMNNNVSSLSIANANNTASSTAAVCGIVTLGATLKTVSGNAIYNLSNTYASFAGSVIGLYFTGSSGTNIVSRNFIYNLSVPIGTTGASIYALKINSGAATYYNNIINLGGTTATTLYGIYDPGTSGTTANIYFNTVYIGGSLGTGVSNQSFALYSAGTANTRNYRDNILVNARSTTGGSGLHYAAYFNYAVSTGLTLDYNDYYTTGTGGVLGYYNSGNKNSLPLVTGLDASSLNLNPGFANPGGIIPTDYMPSSALLAGTTIAAIPTDYLAITRAGTPTMGALEGILNLNVDVYKGAVLLSTYPRLKNAFDKINNGTHTGALEIRIKVSTIETAAAVLYQSGYAGAGGTSSYSSVKIFPTISGITVSGNLNTPLIDLNGADYVTIDGSVNAAGAGRDMVITNANTGTSASTIRFINTAEHNTIKYSTIKGSGTSGSYGIILFSTATAGNGNSGNTIDNNNITSDAAGRPVNALYASGSATYLNSGNIISNNSFYDFLKNGTASYGINIYSNNTGWSVTGNSFYETTSFVPTASVAYNAILVNNASGVGFTVTGNYIGGNTSLCGGSAWTKTKAFNNTFNGIYMNVGTATVSNVQNNTIRNIAWSNYLNAAWTGINIVAGTVNVGTATGNTIGAQTGTGSITVTDSLASTVYGISISATGTVDCEKNVIGAITTGNNSATNATSFLGIYKTGVAGTTTISNNLIGSTTTANSIQTGSASTTDAQSLIGIYFTGTGTAAIDNNTVANLKNSTNSVTTGNAGRVCGIATTNGTNTITNNTIHDLTIANANNSSSNTAAACGIALSTATLKTVSGNTIYNLTNTFSSFGGSVIGIYYYGSTGANMVSGNYIYGLSVTGASSTTASVFGIRTGAGAATYANNIISLAGNTATTIYGIYESGAASNNNNLYFNTIYIGGNLASGITSKSFALYSAATTNTRNFRNNILVNARSTTGGSNLHYCAYFNYAVNTNLTLDYNDYFTTGTGGVLGYYNATNKTTLPIVTGLDAHSSAVTPSFANAGGTQAIDYKISAALTGVTGTGITTDYGSNTRTGPTMGAWEKLGNKWKGTISTAWNTAGNWTENIVPATDASIVFDDLPVNHCLLDQNRSVTGITNGQATYRLVTNGFKLTVKGALTFTNGAQIDASASGSTVEFAGIAPQAIPSGAFLTNQVYNLTVNNATNVTLSGSLKLLNTLAITAGRLDLFTNSTTLEFAGTSPQSIPSGAFNADKIYNLTVNNTANVTLNGSLTLLNTLAATAGSLDAFTNSPTLIYSGSTPQAIGSNLILNNKAYNLTIDNANGVTLNTRFLVTHSLTINSGKKFTVAPTVKLDVTGTLTNNGGTAGFVLQSGLTGNASLIHNTSNVPATVQRSMGTKAEKWHFISSPVASQSITGSWLPAGNYINGTGYDMYVWDEPTSFWIPRVDTTSTINWTTANPGLNFIVGRGYLYSVENPNPMKQFTGNLNNGAVSYNVTTGGTDPAMKGFNLVGNPYPSSMDWQSASGWTRSSLVSSGGGYDMWIWNPVASNYGVCNSISGSPGTNGVTRFIAPTQGYFVHTAAAGTLTVDNPARVQSDTNWFKNAAQAVSLLSLTVTSEGGYGNDEIHLRFGYPSDENGAKKLFSTELTAPSLYLTKLNDNFSVRYYTTPAGNPTVPVSFLAGKNGDYTIHCNFDPANFDTLVLEDMQLHLTQNMKTLNSYGFSATKTDSPNRFVLHFGAGITPAENELPGKIYSNGTNLIIDLQQVTAETDVYVYNVLGQLLFHDKLAGGILHKLDLNTDAQMLLIDLNNSVGSLHKKVLWKKNG
ncbi:MAG: hypothetical protein WCO44_06750 [Bacteroidota bacterium]